MGTAFGVLADPTRRRILALLLDRPRSVGELVGLLSLSQPAISKHLRVLREAGFVTVRQDGQRRFYRLCPEPLRRIDEWLSDYRRFWTDRLAAMERHLDGAEPVEQQLEQQAIDVVPADFD
ncbi:ArsR/SmtB family transcription factor [Amycolatopsis sp. NPDC005003]